jgi:amphi-Trp domain-containing protein
MDSEARAELAARSQYRCLNLRRRRVVYSSTSPPSQRAAPGAREGTEKAVSDVKVEQKQSLSRQDAARFIAALAKGLADDGRVTVQLGSSTLQLSVAGQVDCELEVGVDGDEVELELKLKWSISGRSPADSPQYADEVEADEADDDVSGADEPESEPDEDASEYSTSEPDAATEASDADSAADAPSPPETETVSPSAPERSTRPRRSRRNAAAGTGKAAFNGVDTAAVRAWAAANGVSVSPRGRIKDEVLQAYRAAGN